MKLEFRKPLVPNFIKTKQGHFPISELSEEELTEFAELWCETLKQRREQMVRNMHKED
jgi:hypothetical protein